MPKEYIEREELLNNLKQFAPEHLTPLIVDLVKKQPAADVAEVSNGKWIKTYPDNKLDGNYYCSNCNSGVNIATGEETPIDRALYYCPYCGTKMDGKDGEQ